MYWCCCLKQTQIVDTLTARLMTCSRISILLVSKEIPTAWLYLLSARHLTNMRSTMVSSLGSISRPSSNKPSNCFTFSSVYRSMHWAARGGSHKVNTPTKSKNGPASIIIAYRSHVNLQMIVSMYSEVPLTSNWGPAPRAKFNESSKEPRW